MSCLPKFLVFKLNTLDLGIQLTWAAGLSSWLAASGAAALDSPPASCGAGLAAAAAVGSAGLSAGLLSSPTLVWTSSAFPPYKNGNKKDGKYMKLHNKVEKTNISNETNNDILRFEGTRMWELSVKRLIFQIGAQCLILSMPLRKAFHLQLWVKYVKYFDTSSTKCNVQFCGRNSRFNGLDIISVFFRYLFSSLLSHL